MTFTEQNTFDALRTPRYRLQITYEWFPPEHVDEIIDSMITTIDEEPMILPNGDALYTNLSAEQVSREAWSLGYWSKMIEDKYGIEEAATFNIDMQ